LLNEKQKKPFILLNNEVTEAWHLPLVLLFIQLSYSLTVALLAQVNKALNGLDSSLFCHDTGSIRGQSIFFLVHFSTSFKNKNIYLTH